MLTKQNSKGIIQPSEMRGTVFSQERIALHEKMALAYCSFLRYLYIDNEGDEDLHRSMNEVRIKFLSHYFVTHHPVRPIFGGTPKLLGKKSPERRYLIADYYSETALVRLRQFPGKGLNLAFEHVIPKDALRVLCERRATRREIPTVEEVASALNQTWHIAVITKEEDAMLRPRTRMPAGWACEGDLFARYRSDGTSRFTLLRSSEDGEACMQLLRG